MGLSVAPGSEAPSSPGLPPPAREKQLALYAMMVNMRLFEKRVFDLYLENLAKGPAHLALGQEAIAAGFGGALEPSDYTFATYRGHAHLLARGADQSAMMGELLGRQSGLLHGKGGSMHLADPARGMMGSNAIVGAHLPIAVGAAWSSKVRKSSQVTVCFFGDGTTNIGAFHEALNLAAVWKLPVVFVCENNLYMEYTPISSVIAVEHPAADRASAYGLEHWIVDGNDVEACYGAASVAYGRARSGGGPALIEAKTYRQGGHSRADAAAYRPKAEVEAWLLRDPIDRYRAVLIAAGVSASQLDALAAEAQAAVDRATADAKNGPRPDIASAETNVFADGGSAWRN
jgi:pyruvate dehydrogenase E1 component alpha subunit